MKCLCGAIDPCAALYGFLHLLAYGGYAFTTAGFAKELFLQPPLLVHRLSQGSAACGPLIRCKGRSRLPGPCPEDEKLGQRIGSQTIRPVDTDASDFAGGVEAFDRRGAIHVGMDTSHHVMNDGPHRDQLFDGIDVLILETQLANKGQLRVNELGAQMT